MKRCYRVEIWEVDERSASGGYDMSMYDVQVFLDVFMNIDDECMEKLLRDIKKVRKTDEIQEKNAEKKES